MEKLVHTKLEVTMQPKKKATPNFRHMNKPSQINPCAVLQSCLINTVYQCYKNRWGRGGGLKREGELNNLLPLKRRGRGWGGGVLIRGIMVSKKCFLEVMYWWWSDALAVIFATCISTLCIILTKLRVEIMIFVFLVQLYIIVIGIFSKWWS